MKKITKSILTLALLLVGATSAYAGDIVEDLTAAMFHEWNATDGSAIVSKEDATTTASWEFNVGKEISAGNVLCGTGSVNGFVFADLSDYTKITFTGTPAEGKTFTLRILYNRVGAGGANEEKQVSITAENPSVDFSIETLGVSYFHLVSIKVAWGENAGTISSIKVTKPEDPLAVPKANLKNAINTGKSRNSYAKTTASWNDLQDAISAGETELAKVSATAESLASAKTAIEDAIAGLKLEDGFVNLTKTMFHEWTGIEDDATIKGNGGCDLVLNESIGGGGMLYGNASVKWDQYAKLVNAKSLVILGTPGITLGARTDRLEVGNGGGDGNGGAVTTIDITIDEDGKGILDLSDKASIRINAIKNSWGGAVTVTDLLVEYKPVAATIGTDGYATFAADKAVKFEGVEAYVAKVNGSSLTLTAVTETPANTAVILKGAADTYSFPVIDGAAAVDNDLKVSDGNVATAGNIYVLANKSKGVGFYKLDISKKVPAGKAYIELAPGAPALEFIGFDMETTGINSLTPSPSPKGEGSIYNLAGQRVAQPTKGLYIVNGRKVVVK